MFCLLSDIPAAPIPGNVSFTPTDLTFSWTSSSNSACFLHYSVNVTDDTSSIVFTTTDTNLSLPISAPFNDTEYSISVAAVDTGGRYMNPQGMERYIADGKCYEHNNSICTFFVYQQFLKLSLISV